MEEAQTAVKKGFELCLKDRFDEALENFQAARKLFLEAGNIIEAETISAHFIAYCYHNTNRRRQARDLFEKVDDFCDKRNYKWLLLVNIDWLIGNEETLKYKTYTEIKSAYETALEKAEKIRDIYTIQKLLLSLLRKRYFVNQESDTFTYLHKLFQISKQPNISARQKFRNFDKAIPIFALSRFPSMAKEVVLESVSLAEPMSDPLFVIDSQVNSAIVHTQTEDYETAEELLKMAMQNTEKLAEENQQITRAKIFLQMGHLEKKRERWEKAAEFYNSASVLVDKLDSPLLLYEIKKARLIAYQRTGNDTEVKKDIDPTLGLAEKYRERISEEHDRNSFFDNQQNVYDIAVEHNLRLGQLEEAYNYSELSSSRSLLDWLVKGANISIRGNEAKILFDNSVKPLKIEEIRKRIPPQVQLLQYSVIEDKILIWIIRKEQLKLVSSEINSDELKAEVENYLESIRKKRFAEDRSRRLYELLIAPALPYLEQDTEICIIPDKILFHLPFSSLISADGNYFLEQFESTYSPSANVFVYSTEKAKSMSKFKDEKILSVGNPAFDAQNFPYLEDLPEAETEAREIARNYQKSQLLINREATKNSFQQIYRNFEIIHFAGHYVVQPDYPLFSKLVMAKSSGNKTDDFLTNFELMEKRLSHTKLIILSACETGVEKYSDSEGLLGLSRTFLSLGVPLIVASRWKIDSDAAAELMKDFHYFRRAEKLSTNRALHRAQLKLLKTQNSRFQQPYFWAGFDVFGGYAEF